MPSAAVVNEIEIERTPRVMQLEGLFDLPPASRSQRRWTVDLPIDSRAWNVGVIVGPSGSGKTSIARNFFPGELNRKINWPSGRSIVDAFPSELPLGDIASLLNAVGFSSPPSWLRPYQCLSTGEQFRADLARRIADRLSTVGYALRAYQPNSSNVGLTQMHKDASRDDRSGWPGRMPAGDDSLVVRVPKAREGRKQGPTERPQPADALASSRPCVIPSSNPTGALDPIVVDEFTSSLDQTVACLGSAAVSKAIRAHGLQFIAISCHEDVIDWLDPDWIYRPDADSFSWRLLQGRPRIELVVSPAPRAMWNLFRPHHYLTSALSPSAQCYVGMVEGRPAAFTAVIHFPHPTSPGWREHRTVCLPDFQGVGLGNAQSDLVAGMYCATGKPYRSVTSAPAMIRYRARSPNWFMTRKPSRVESAHRAMTMKRRSAHERITASFEYVGPPREKEAKKLGII